MKRITLLLLLLAAALHGLIGQSDFTTQSSLFGALRARHIGPAVMSGRISTIAVHPEEPEVIYVGAAGGGVWKTVSGGTIQRPIFDDYTQSIGKIALAPSDPDIIYVGTGEQWTRNSVSVGTGIYRSTDGGVEWKHLGLEGTERISDIVVHPEDPDVVYVAALGHLWDANEERGVFKTTDGGATWEKVLYIDEDTGATDLDLDPRNPDVVYAVMWSHRRWPWTFDSGFTGGSGVYKSTDGGANWATIHEGLPTGKLGRMAIGVAPSNGDVIYLSVECEGDEGDGLYRSQDAGGSWEMVSNEFNTTIRPFYFANLTVDPTNDSIVAKCGLNAIISEDAGTTFRGAGSNVHSDIHDIWISPHNPKHILLATDGGIYESVDRGYTFKMWMNLPVSQFYHVSVDDAKPFNVYGGLQDNGSWYGPSQKAGGIGNSDWESVYGGDGFYVFRHPTREEIVFAEYQGGNLVRFNKNTGVAKSIAPYAQGEEEKLRFNWNAPIHLSRSRPGRMYFGSQYLFKSEDMGDSWTTISPDLTTDDPAKQRQFESGGLSIDNSTAENHCTIYAIGESPVDESIIWVGTDDGNLQVTSNGGAAWTNVVANVPELPEHTWVTYVEPSPHDALTCYVTFDGHRTGDMATYLYKTTDLGQTWTRLQGEALEGYALSVRQDLVAANLLFLGTEFGLFISLDGGDSWARFENNMPKVGVREMVIHPRDHALVMATHGRGIILLDDLTPLRQITPEVVAEKIAFIETPPTLLRDPGAGGNWFGGSGNFVAGNPSTAAEVVYHMSRRHTFGRMYFEVYKDGELVQELQAGKAAGINIVEMPTRMEKPRAAPSNNRQALFGSIFGPNLAAGVYDVHLIKGRDTFKTTFTLEYDPDAPYTLADREKQREVTMQLYHMSEELAYLYAVLDGVKSQVEGAEGLRRRARERADALVVALEERLSTLVALGGDGYVNEGEELGEAIAQLYAKVSQYPGRPSEPQVTEANRLESELRAVRDWLDHFLAGELAITMDDFEKAGLEPITWPSKEDFLSKDEAGGSSSGQWYHTEKALFRALQDSPFAAIWLHGWLR